MQKKKKCFSSILWTCECPPSAQILNKEKNSVSESGTTFYKVNVFFFPPAFGLQGIIPIYFNLDFRLFPALLVIVQLKQKFNCHWLIYRLLGAFHYSSSQNKSNSLKDSDKVCRCFHWRVCYSMHRLSCLSYQLCRISCHKTPLWVDGGPKHCFLRYFSCTGSVWLHTALPCLKWTGHVTPTSIFHHTLEIKFSIDTSEKAPHESMKMFLQYMRGFLLYIKVFS